MILHLQLAQPTCLIVEFVPIVGLPEYFHGLWIEGTLFLDPSFHAVDMVCELFSIKTSLLRLGCLLLDFDGVLLAVRSQLSAQLFETLGEVIVPGDECFAIATCIA